MCRQYYHLKDEEFTEQELQAMWFNHMYEEQFALGNLQQEQFTSQLSQNIINSEDKRTTSPRKRVI